MKTCSTRLKRLDGNLNVFKTVDCSLTEMSVNRKGEKLNFELAPAVSYKSGLEIGEKTSQQVYQIFIITVVVVIIIIIG